MKRVMRAYDILSQDLWYSCHVVYVKNPSLLALFLTMLLYIRKYCCQRKASKCPWFLVGGWSCPSLSVIWPCLFAENSVHSFVPQNTVYSCTSFKQENDLLLVKHLLWHVNGLRTWFSNSIPVLLRCTLPRRRFVLANNGSFKLLYICSTVYRHFVNLWYSAMPLLRLSGKIIAQRKNFAA